MAFESQERMLAKAAEAAKRDFSTESSEPSSSQTTSRSAGTSDQGEAFAGRRPAPLHILPLAAIAPPRAFTPPPQYEEAPAILVEDTNRDVEVGVLDRKYPRPKELERDYYHYKKSKSAFWRTKQGILLLILFSNIIILAAVLGGVLGSRSINSSNNSGPQMPGNTISAPLLATEGTPRTTLSSIPPTPSLLPTDLASSTSTSLSNIVKTEFVTITSTAAENSPTVAGNTAGPTTVGQSPGVKPADGTPIVPEATPTPIPKVTPTPIPEVTVRPADGTPISG